MIRGSEKPCFRLIRLVAIVVVLMCGATSEAISVQEITRLRGQGESVLQGLGLVIGLPGTGDSGEDLLVARPLAELLANSGNAVGSFEELAASQSAAIVMVTARIPESGGKSDDKFDVIVSAINNPESLEGGELFITPMRGPLPGQPVFAFAQGSLVLEGENVARARVRGGAQLVRDINMPTIQEDGSVTLLLRPSFAGWTTSQLIADTINQHRLGFDTQAEEIAYAVDDRTVRVQIPTEELADPANFLADILSIQFDGSLLELPARVVVNEREGVIIATGNARITAVVISHGNMVVTTVNEVGGDDGDENPMLTRAGTTGGTRVEDLLAAFRQLDVSVEDQIAIFSQLHRSGRLLAELVIE
ncbi:MAG: flagellar basal body P-ring protein FlgI [Planctomycetota bacterium]